MLARALRCFLMLSILAEIQGIVGGYVLGFQTILGITALFHLSGEHTKIRFFRKGFKKNLICYLSISEASKTIDKLLIPTKMKAKWNLNGGDFEYFNGTIINYQIY